MSIFNSTFILRLAVAIILIAHSIPGMFTGDVTKFGELYLNPIGFAPFGILIAWLIKLSHVGAAISLLFEKYVKWSSIVTIFILVMGIVMVHWKEGWYVVGGGRNGIEFNFILIAVLLSFLFPKGFSKK